MESLNNEASSRSLPPLVEGKIHGYLKLVIDEIVWSRRSPGDVTVLASWWGELDSAQFRPADLKGGDNRSEADITETYAIRTNIELFKEYLKNCETVELVVISEKNHQVVGTAQVSELVNLTNEKSYFQYVSIINDNGSRIGDIHVTMKLSITKNSKSPAKKQLESETSPIKETCHSRHYDDEFITKSAFPYENDVPVAIKNAKQNENVYRSILKERADFEHSTQFKSYNGVNDKLVAQVVARAQRLRGAILNESRDENPLGLSEGSAIDSSRSDVTDKNEANLYEYFLGKKMSRYAEKKALEALRSTSPTPSLIDLAAETIRTCRNDKSLENLGENKISMAKSDGVDHEISPVNDTSNQRREASPIDYVDSLRIAVESLTLTPAGYRRVRSSCLSRGDGVPISVTYFVQYDPIFGNAKRLNRKIINESKPVKLCSKKQVGQVVYFNHEAVYELSKNYLHMDLPLRFKIFNRHLNQRTPTELGIGSIYVGDAVRSRSMSTIQRLAIVNKGIKIGELKVTVELGCDKIHFGKQFVEAVTSAKENIPVLEVSSNLSLDSSKYRTATGGSKENSGKPSSTSLNRPENSWSVNNSARLARQETSQRRDRREDERAIDLEDPRREFDDKVLLHGLIYIAEGKDLSSSSTYLICRAFWREDRSASRVCEQTYNPFYHFHQLVPLIHSPDLLERTKDNCIAIEVYSRNQNGTEELLGISKLPVHQLYVAYRDPRVLPHLLRSKYPVISVDGWVTVADPVTSRSCGQILALVALGTADQIALLEMTRGLRDSSVTPRFVRDPPRNSAEMNPTIGDTFDARYHQNERRRIVDGHQDIDVDHRINNQGNSEDRCVKTQECQTEITTVKYFKPSHVGEEFIANENPQSQMFNAIVDKLAEALNVPKSSADQAAQTEEKFTDGNVARDETKIHDVEPLNLQTSTNNSFSGDSSDAGSQRDNFNLSTEIYRSVGVGAEFDEATNQGASTSYAQPISSVSNGFNAVQMDLPDRKNENSHSVYNVRIPETITSARIADSVCDERFHSENENSSFRAVVEIECALHLPRVERIDDTVEPCTYVTFQKARNNRENQYGCYVVTNLYPFSCSPKWDWRGDTKLSNDLLDNEEKRLILKVWRLADPETSMEINLERDIVIGFSAIDVSILTVGFPVVSGWFHVMDFTGKCNGQIKVSVTPLDNIAAFGKNTCPSNAARPPLPDFDHSNFSSPYPADIRNDDEPQNFAGGKAYEIVNNHVQRDNEPTFDLGLGDASMSFLSLSLKQKLTELDEIKKRLQTRLHDVTNTAFDDDFDNDFDMPLAENDDYVENVNGNIAESRNVLREMENWRVRRETMENPGFTERGTMTNGNRSGNSDEIDNVRLTASNSNSVDANYTDTGYSTSSNVQSYQNIANGNRYSALDDNRFRSRQTSDENVNGYESVAMFANATNQPNDNNVPHQQGNPRNRTDLLNVKNYCSVDHGSSVQRLSAENIDNVAMDDTSNDSGHDNPIRGTRMHISHLLDKLTTQLSSVPPPTTNQPMKRNIMDLITSLRRNNNNFSNDVKCNREVNVRTVPTQTETNYTRVDETRNTNCDDIETPAKSQRRNNKVSSAIREELAADESNETHQECDELSVHLMTSNVRHTDFQSILNPLLYPHLIPDVRCTANGEETVDSSNSTDNRASGPEVEALERLDTRYEENFAAAINNGLSRLRNLMETESSTSRNARSFNNDDSFRATTSGVSENIDGNIDVTVIHKPCNDDLMASNSIESTTTISLDNDLLNATEIDDNSSLNSTETSVSGVSRQAPDGGNPIEESTVSIVKAQNDSRDSSSAS